MTQPREPRSGRAQAITSHLFRETNDPGLGAVSSGSGYMTFGHLASATAYLRATRCALPGCGKPREDPIHSPAEE